MIQRVASVMTPDQNSEADEEVCAFTSSAARRSLPWVGLFVVVSLVRYLFTLPQRMPDVAHDEFAQLAIARFVGRNGHWNMFDLATWQPGFGLLISPIAAITDDPVALYRSALVVNCFIGGASAVALGHLVRRCIAHPLASTAWCVVVAGAISLSPALIRTSAFVWAEPGVALTFSLSLSLVVRYRQRDSTRDATLAILIGAAGYLLHGRMLAALVAITMVSAVIAWTRSPRASMALAALGAISLACVEIITLWITDAVWEAPSSDNTVGGTLSRLTNPTDLAIGAIGQAWYLSVASLGVFSVGVIVVIGAVARRSWATEIIDQKDARTVGSIVAAPAVVSVVFLAGRVDRADYVMYGRYNDAVVGIVIALGAAGIAHWSTSRARWLYGIAALIATTSMLGALSLERFRGDVLATRTVFRTMVPGLIPFVYGPPRKVLLVTMISMALFSTIVVVTRRFGSRGPHIAIVLGVLVLAGALRIAGAYQSGRNVYEPLRVAEDIRQVVAEQATITVQLPPESAGAEAYTASRVELSVFQFFLPGHRFVSLSAPAAGTTSSDDPKLILALRQSGPPSPGADPVWDDPVSRWILWRDAGP